MEPEIKHICIYGVGGVGGFFGGKIARHVAAADADKKVYFIARGDHLGEIRKNGLILNTDDESGMVCRPAMATDAIADLPSVDLCLVCVKSYDLDGAIKSVIPVISENTILLPLLNGVDMYERIRGITDRGIVLPACVYIGTHIERPGVVTQKGGSCTILFGPDPKRAEFDPHGIAELFDGSAVKYKWLPDPSRDIWEKFIFIAAFGLVTAACRKSIGEVMHSEELRSDVRAIMEEIQLIAVKKNIMLPDNIIDASIKKGDNFPFITKTSFQRDVEQSKKDERDCFGGTVMRFGKSLGISTEMTERYYSML